MTSRKIKPFHLEYVNMWMSNTSNPELTAQCILQKLEKQCGVQVSKEYVCALRRRLNWSAKHMKYGQLISHKNVRLRCDWCFHVVYVDESTVEMCSSGRLVFHQHGSNLDRLPAKSPKPKHFYKVNVWGGISYRGPTDICVFTGIMDSEIYQKILEDNLLPFTSFCKVPRWI